MKAVVKTVTGETHTLNVSVTKDLLSFFTGKEGFSSGLTLGWVSYVNDNGNKEAINFAYVVHVEFCA